MHFRVDSKFLEHFRELKQVFLYVIDECNLRCVHCLYKPDLLFHMKQKEIPLDTALRLVSDFREMGASKLTIMGGEPTLYGAAQGHHQLITLVAESKKMGYEYVRMDTNGVFNPSLVSDLLDLDEISFSLDGPTPAISDSVRGKGAFDRCVSNIRRAVELRCRVDITCCIHRALLQRDANGRYFLYSMIELARELGATRINFHDLFKSGIPRDAWTGQIDLMAEEWMDAYRELECDLHHDRFGISVRLPRSFVSTDEYRSDPDYYGYCPARMGERVLVHPNGILRICSLMIGTPYGVGRFDDEKIMWDDTPTNELTDHKMDIPTPCVNQSKDMRFHGIVPLCVSFKPRQDEVIWRQKIAWDSRKA